MVSPVDLHLCAGCHCLAARRRARAITRTFDARLRRHGLKATQFSVLAALALGGPSPIGELAEGLGLERTTLTRSAALLEKRGWITSDRSRDRREHPVKLTPSGRRKLESAFPAWQAAQDAVEETLRDAALASATPKPRGRRRQNDGNEPRRWRRPGPCIYTSRRCHMVDMVGAIGGTAVYAVLVGVLVGLSPAGRAAKLAALAAAAAWGGIIVATGAIGGFAPVAGARDMVVAALAIPLAIMAGRGTGERPAWLGLWNALGALDLVVAIALGLLSAPGTPLRVFTEGSGTVAMTALPWVMVPAMLVPLYLLTHLAIAVKLGSSRPGAQAVAMAR